MPPDSTIIAVAWASPEAPTATLQEHAAIVASASDGALNILAEASAPIEQLLPALVNLKDAHGATQVHTPSHPFARHIFAQPGLTYYPVIGIKRDGKPLFHLAPEWIFFRSFRTLAVAITIPATVADNHAHLLYSLRALAARGA